MHYVIVGAGPAGVVAAETLRRTDPSGSITLVGDEPEPPYSRMALPYLLADHIDEAGTHLRHGSGHYQALEIALRRDTAASLAPETKTLTLAGGDRLSYDRLLIATGARPVMPPIPGIDLPGVVNCWTLADKVGSAMIVGAFAGGIILSRTNQFDTIEAQIKPVADVFTPIFFLSIGAQFDIRLLNVFDPGTHQVLMIGGVLFFIAVVGKVAAGWAAPWRKFNRPAVGFGMMPRGEVGLIFANIGLAAGVLTAQLFSAIILMVIGTTLAAPPFVKWSFNRWKTTDPPVG